MNDRIFNHTTELWPLVGTLIIAHESSVIASYGKAQVLSFALEPLFENQNKLELRNPTQYTSGANSKFLWNVIVVVSTFLEADIALQEPWMDGVPKGAIRFSKTTFSGFSNFFRSVKFAGVIFVAHREYSVVQVSLWLKYQKPPSWTRWIDISFGFFHAWIFKMFERRQKLFLPYCGKYWTDFLKPRV